MSQKEQIAEIVAGAYGQPYAVDGCDFIPEDTDQTVKRVQVMSAKVTEWMVANGRVPSTNPNAPMEEQMLGHWMMALQFYSHIAYDPQNETKKLVKVGDFWHDRFQRGTRWGGYLKPE